MASAAIELGIEDLGDLVLGLAIDFDWRRWWLDAVRYDIGCSGFELRNMEHRVYRGHRVREANREGERTDLCDDGVRAEILF